MGYPTCAFLACHRIPVSLESASKTSQNSAPKRFVRFDSKKSIGSSFGCIGVVNLNRGIWRNLPYNKKGYVSKWKNATRPVKTVNIQFRKSANIRIPEKFPLSISPFFTLTLISSSPSKKIGPFFRQTVLPFAPHAPNQSPLKPPCDPHSCLKYM